MNGEQQNSESKTAFVVSAIALTNNEKEELSNVLSRFLVGKSVILDCHVDRNVLGGLRVEVDDWVLDTTIASQLKKLTHVLES